MDKELLIKELCLRLPYGVKVGMGVELDANYPYILLGINPTARGCAEIYIARNGVSCSGSIDAIKPYLRPISSMTEEEKKELAVVCSIEYIDDKIVDFGEFSCEGSPINIKNIYDLLDWLNAHHFDYRGLIEQGLALEVPEGMYKF